MREVLHESAIQLLAPVPPELEAILSPEALTFVAHLERSFRARRRAILGARVVRQRHLDAGERLDFLPETRDVRESNWSIAPVPADLLDRRVEITGPVDRKMVINALNSGASMFMADFEDSTSPTWTNLVEGQQNLFDAVRRTIAFSAPNGKHYELVDSPATLLVRPRGWHLDEKHMLVDGERVSGSLFDFGLFFFHNARELLSRGSGPYFYLPKLEGHLEARLWNDVFVAAQKALEIPRGSIKATVLIETITAAFEMDEILCELREHSAGLNCGRWDYIFSFIKRFRAHPDFVLPDRAKVTMTAHFMRSYCRLLVKTCHRRGAHAMGGMAAQIPIKNDPLANDAALSRVVEDKLREAREGHDGTWVAHPGLVDVARKVFDRTLVGPNQLDVLRENVEVTADDLLTVPEGSITADGLRMNLQVGVEYVAAWLRGSGCVPLNHLMEDAATAEISRAQVWQWVRHPAGKLDDGRPVNLELVAEFLEDVLQELNVTLGRNAFDRGRFEEAATLIEDLVSEDDFVEFLTLPAYEKLDCERTGDPS